MEKRKLNEEELKAIEKFEQDCNNNNNVKTFHNVETDGGYGFLKDKETGEIIHTYKVYRKSQYLVSKELKTYKKLLRITIALAFTLLVSHIFIAYLIFKSSK